MVLKEEPDSVLATDMNTSRRSLSFKIAILTIPALMLQALLLWSWIQMAFDSQEKPCNSLTAALGVHATNVLNKSLQPVRILTELLGKRYVQCIVYFN